MRKGGGRTNFVYMYRHLGQRDMYLPTSHGFDEYLGIPFSQDMGLSYWYLCNGPPTEDGKAPAWWVGVSRYPSL
jgi:hypothetical protein